MGEKTVTLSANTAEKLEEYRKLRTKYEKLMREICGIDAYHPEDDGALICVALGAAIDNIGYTIRAMEDIRAGGAS